MKFNDFTPRPVSEPIGLHRLIEEYGLASVPPAVRSEAIKGSRRTIIADGAVLEQYPASYAPRDIFGHLRFAMRYEPVDLGVLADLFAEVKQEELTDWIRTEPVGRHTRRVWYLYELLTGKRLDLADVPPTGNVLLLNPALQLTTTGVRIRRQRVVDNLLGNARYCPLIRRTPRLNAAMQQHLEREAARLLEGTDPDLLARAVHYLFTKETKSSFAIEGEAPGTGRTQRFVAALGRTAEFNVADPGAFFDLQNLIVDARYAQRAWRTVQVYVGQTASNYSEIIHFIGPRPDDIPGLMQAWMEMVQRIEAGGVDPICAAALTGFGFVFLHPFDDGNGRIHRFLIHHTLAKLGFAPPGVLFPVSAVMLRDAAAYEAALNAFSARVLPRMDYEMDGQQRLTVRNPTDRLFRFFDATAQAEYLYDAVAETIRKDLREEIEFLQVWEQARAAVQSVVDMPSSRATLLLRLMQQNQGRLSHTKRPLFAELSDAEIAAMEAALAAVAPARGTVG